MFKIQQFFQLAMALITLGSYSPVFSQTLVWGQSQEAFSRNYSIAKTELGSNVIETILKGEVPHSLCRDKTTLTIFWSESGNNDIWKYSIVSNTKQKIFHSEDSLRGLVFDQGKLYFATHVGVYKMNVDGSEIEPLVTTSGVDEITVANGIVYWTGAYTGNIWKQNTNGIGGSLLYVAPKAVSDLQFNPTDSKLYWRVYFNNGDTLYFALNKAELDGSGVVNIWGDTFDAFCFDDTGTKIYCNSSGYSSIFSIDTNGGNKVDVFQSSVYVDKFWSPIKISVTGGRIFWFSYYYGDYLRYGTLTNIQPKTIATRTVYRPTRVAVDTAQQWIYWVNSSGSIAGDPTVSIRRARLDGTGVEVLHAYPYLTYPYGIEIDALNQKIYWTDYFNTNGIRRSNTNGSSPQNLVSGSSYDPSEAAIDVPNNRIFWTDNYYDRVMKCALDGSGISVVASNLSSPGSIAYDAIADSIYFGDNNSIKRVAPNGGGLTTLKTFTGINAYVNSICIDHANNYMYWTEVNGSIGPLFSIMRARLDGSETIVLVDSSQHAFNMKGVRVYPSGSLLVKTKTPANTEADMQVFPNPFHDYINIAHTLDHDILRIYDALGRVVLVETLETADISEIDTAALTPGLYVLTLQRRDGATTSYKAIKTP